MTNYNYFHVWRDITFRDAGRDITLPEGHDVILGGDIDNYADQTFSYWLSQWLYNLGRFS